MVHPRGARVPAPTQGRARHRRDAALADAHRGDSGLRLPALPRTGAPLRIGLQRRHASGMGQADPWLARRGARHDVYAYFNNDEMGYAPKNAMRLRELASG